MGKLKKLFLIIASFAAVFAFAIIGVNSVPTSVVNIGGTLNYSSNFIFTIIDSNTVSVRARVNTISGDIEIPSQVTISNHLYSVVTIDENGFKNCSNITDLKVPSTITSIGSSAFDGCSNMENVTIDSSYVYTNLTSKTALGNLIASADTINLKTSADNGTNSFLNDNYIKSQTISGYNTYSFAYLITIPTGEGYELQNTNNTTFTTTKVRPGDSISFKVAIQTGYTQSTPVVKSNGTTLTATSGVYTISNIQANQVLTVEGVEKNTYTLTFPSNVTVTRNGTPLVTGATITHFDTLIISYTETTGYHKTSFKVNGVEKTSGVSVTVTGDVTVTYAEEINKYTVTFAVNNASYGSVSRASQAEVPYGSTITVSGNTVTINGVSTTATPTAITGYTTAFSSWTNATGTITDARTITANFTKTAHTYTVQYNTWNGTAVATSSHTYDTAKNLTTYAALNSANANAFVVTGYTFAGWATTAHNTTKTGTVVHTDGKSVTNLTATNGATVNLYATYTANEISLANQAYTLTYSTSSQTQVITGATNGTGSYTYAITAGNASSYFSISGTTITVAASTPAGTYPLTVQATDDETAKTATATITITINKAAATISFAESSVEKTISDTDFTNTLTNTGDGTVTYSSSATGIVTVNSSTGLVHIVGDGTAIITATVTDGTNYTYATSTATYTLTVKTPVALPIDSSTTYTYNGSSQTYYPANWASISSLVDISGNTRTNAGSQNVTFSLKDSSTYVWADGTTTDKILTFTIENSATLILPTQDAPQNCIYNGGTKTPTWDANYDSNKMTIGGTTSSSSAGTHTATFTPKANYAWADTGTTEARNATWDVRLWIGDDVSVEYDGTLKTPTEDWWYYFNAAGTGIVDYDSSLITITGGTTSATNAGNYTIQITPHTGYKWRDGTSTAKSVPWEIRKVSTFVPIPTSLTYNGSSQSPTWLNWDDSLSDISGTTSATNAGTYTATFTLKDPANYKWNSNGGGSDPKDVNWTINVLSASIVFYPNTVSKFYGEADFTNTLTNTGDGTVTYSSSDTSVATINSSTGLVHIVGVGSATITATVTNTANCTYSTSTATFTLTVRKGNGAILYPEDDSYWQLDYSAEPSYNYHYCQFLIAGDATPTYTSSNTSVATIDSDGIIHVIGIGTTTLTVTVYDTAHYTYSEKTVSHILTVNKGYQIISTNPWKNIEIPYGTASQTITVSVVNDGVTLDNSLVTVSDDNATAISSISNGVITVSNLGAINAGTTIYLTITAPETTYFAERTIYVPITIVKKAATISYVEDDITKTGFDADFINPLTNTGDGVVTYSIEYDTGEGSITLNSSTGLVHLVRACNTVLIAATVADSTNYTYANKTVYYTLEIEPGEQNISLSETSISIPYGTTSCTFTATTNGALSSLSVSDDNTTATSNISNGTITVSNLGSINAGTVIRVTVGAPDTDLIWGDSKTCTITIVRANQTITLSDTVINVPVSADSITFTASTSGDGTLSVSDDTFDLVSRISNGVVTIENLAVFDSDTIATITVTASMTTNYNSATATCILYIQPSAITFTGDGAFTFRIGGGSTTGGWDGMLEYKVNNGNWTVLNKEASGTISVDASPYKLYLRGSSNTVITGNNTNKQLNVRRVNVGTSISVSGNIMSLLRYQMVDNATMADYCFSYLFGGQNSSLSSHVVDASELMFPATYLSLRCYNNMFYGCTSLTTAPAELSATTLVNYCYNGMFYGCTSLTTAPELPATTLADYCYQNMFYNCTSLTTAPELPATTLNIYCYQSMFYGCTNLTSAPELPATTLATGCYYRMFYQCTSLKDISALSATTLESSCYQNMFYGCSKLRIIQSTAALTGDDLIGRRLILHLDTISPTNAVTNMFTNCFNGTGYFRSAPTAGKYYYVEYMDIILYTSSGSSRSVGSADFTPSLTNTGDGSPTFTSSNTSVATVNASTGKIHVVAPGTATITATVADTPNSTYRIHTATYTVTVRTPVDLPTANTTTFNYNGSTQYYYPANWDSISSYCNISGNSATSGSQTVTVSLKNTTNYSWSDGTITNKTFTFTINNPTFTNNYGSTITVNGSSLSSGSSITIDPTSSVSVSSIYVSGYNYRNPVGTVRIYTYYGYRIQINGSYYSSQYNYNSSSTTYSTTIPASAITGNISIISDSEIKTYTN